VSHDQEQADTAQDYAALLKREAMKILAEAGHADCSMLASARYVPESGAVVCGCGEFEPWSDSPDSPPWEPTADDDRAAFSEPPAPRPGGALTYEAQDPIRSTLALIDPSQIYTPEEVERHILDTLYRLETGQLAERKSVELLFKTKQAFDLKFNACIATSSGGAADIRKAMAMNDCSDEYAAMLEAEMVAKAIKATMHNLRSVITGYQSVAKSVTASYQAGGSQGGPPQSGRPW